MVSRLRAPGYYRAGLGLAAGIGFSMFITWIVRMAYGHTSYHHYFDPTAWVTVSLLAAPIGWLIGFGAFDYWLRWAAGKPTIPEDHSGHGARTWHDYFRVNTDH